MKRVSHSLTPPDYPKNVRPGQSQIHQAFMEERPRRRSNTPSERPVEKWNQAKELPDTVEAIALEAKKLYRGTLRILKLLTYVGCFSLALASSIVSKMAILLMTSQLRPENHRPLCFDVSRRRREVETSYHERIQWTWMLYFCFIVPEILTFLRSARILTFKKQLNKDLKGKNTQQSGDVKALGSDTEEESDTEWDQEALSGQSGKVKSRNWMGNFLFMIPLFFEMCHVTGLGLLVFIVLPSVHVVKGSMLGNAVCLIPAILSLFFHKFKATTIIAKYVFKTLDGVALIFQLLGLVLWPLLLSDDGQYRIEKPWLVPLAGILISCGWWENYIPNKSELGFFKFLARIRKNLYQTRYRTHIYTSLIKMLLFLAVMCLCIWINGENPREYFWEFKAAFGDRKLNATEIDQTIAEGILYKDSVPSVDGSILRQEILPVDNNPDAAINVFAIQIAAAFLCHFSSKFANKICIQSFGFALPLTLSVPVTIAVLLSMCFMRSEEVCMAQAILPGYLFWNCPQGSFKDDFLSGEKSWLWIFLLLSQVWTTIHVWYPKLKKLSKTDTIFYRPFYSAFLTDQDLVLNQKRPELVEEDSIEHMNTTESPEESSDLFQMGAKKDAEEAEIPHIISCATMYREGFDEILAMIRSVCRMDKDQRERQIARKTFHLKDPGYYTYETQIFFDNAFESKTKNGPRVINESVENLIKALSRAASEVHQTPMRIKPPKKVPTQYGGRLEFTLTCGSRLTVHLKDETKIRKRKRWSQCMYMYYLIGFLIDDNKELTPEQQKKKAQNTFILALDADIDFQPKAVEKLVDKMRVGPKLGAACGRIHPIGPGPMVWYQKFEYAIGHWLQKATEHMLGCVLCAPGCFTLFRVEALKDDNVMRTYTKEPTAPFQRVQYDQGEDRWLCTLLLQQGRGVVYCAASDALTHAPTNFDDFFTQRKRWIPSTIFNILDLLIHYKKTVKKNPDISRSYIYYQFFLMASSILGPGTIFLMLVGAFVTAFRIDNVTSFFVNLVPLLLFILVCYFGDQKMQLAFAKLLSAIYSLIMVAVLIALIIQIIEDGPLAPSSLFLLAVAGSFIITGLLHPLEVGCLFHGVLYFLIIPSMYLLLIIYSLFNLNDINWGTRENKPIAKKGKKTKKRSLLQGLLPGTAPTIEVQAADEDEDDEEGRIEFSCSNLFKCMCCTDPKPKTEHIELVKSIKDLKKVILSSSGNYVDSLVGSSKSTNPALISNTGGSGSAVQSPVGGATITFNSIQEDMFNFHWMEHELLEDASVDFLSQKEIEFWKIVIHKYLKPEKVAKTKEELKKQGEKEAELLKLRNDVVQVFLLFNAFFVVALFLFQLKKDVMYFDWPWGAKHNFTYVNAGDEQILIQTENLHLEPLGTLFLIFYALVMALQFGAMLLHRFETFIHIMADTTVDLFSLCRSKKQQLSLNGEIMNREQVQKWTSIKKANESILLSPVGTLSKGPRPTKIMTMDAAFTKNYERDKLLIERKSKKGLGSQRNSNALEIKTSLIKTRESMAPFNNNNAFQNSRQRFGVAKAAARIPSTTFEMEQEE